MLSYGAVGGLVGVAVGCYLIRKWTSRQWGYFKSDKSLKGQVSRQEPKGIDAIVPGNFKVVDLYPDPDSTTLWIWNPDPGSWCKKIN
jgi:hypothetical protein